MYNNVKAITVEVGDLASPPIEDLKEHLSAIISWDLIVKSKKATINCDCGFKGEPNIRQKNHTNVIYNCPECEALLPEILDGDKIILTNVEVE